MIDPQTYSAGTAGTAFQGEVRTAGYMPVAGQKKADAADSFSGMVQKAATAGETGDAATPAGEASHGGFFDFLIGLFDIINPLEHIPVISTIYENVTGHHMSPMARIAGDTLYGGPIGTAIGIANVVTEEKTGKDIGANVMAMVTGSGQKDAAQVMIAQNAPPKSSDIVWNTAPAATGGAAQPDDNVRLALLALAREQNSPASVKTSSQTPGAGEAEQVAELPPVPGAGKDFAVASGQKASAPADSTSPSPPQNAPADAPSRAIPPELIAQKMMSGLDKYAALKQNNMISAYDGNF